jgi:AraC-like DNA-binding protein
VTRQATLTPRAETVTEVSALWGLAEQRVRHELNVALFREQYFPEAWAMCLTGQLDCYRASVVADHVRHAVSDPVQIRMLAARITDFLCEHLSAAHGLDEVPPVVGCTPKQLRNKLSYEIKRLRCADAEDRHRQAYADRGARATELEDGMAHLGITATVDQVRLAEHRLTHAARQLRNQGDPRTLAQLRSDLHHPAGRADLASRDGPVGRLLRALLRRPGHPVRARPPDPLARGADPDREPVAGLQARAHRQAHTWLQHRAGAGRLLRAAHARRVKPRDQATGTTGQ